MSAILKPCIHTVNSDAAVSAVVNAEHIHAVSTVDAPGIGDNGKDVFKILFSVLCTDNQVKSVEWVYTDDSAQRDTDYAAVVAAVSTAI